MIPIANTAHHQNIGIDRKRQNGKRTGNAVAESSFHLTVSVKIKTHEARVAVALAANTYVYSATRINGLRSFIFTVPETEDM